MVERRARRRRKVDYVEYRLGDQGRDNLWLNWPSDRLAFGRRGASRARYPSQDPRGPTNDGISFCRGLAEW